MQANTALALRDLYRRTLLDDVVPFWITHAIDPNGGINTCLGDDGVLISRDRWNWSQWRAVWVFSRLYNAVEPRPQWQAIARGIYDFITAHGPLPDGHWPLLLDGEGTVLRGFDSIYVDGFAIYGLAEYYRASRDPRALDLALRTFAVADRAIEAAEPPPAWPYPIRPGWQAHGVSMVFSLAYEESGAPWCWEWHERIRDYCWRHYPVKPHGEWQQKLDRQGRRIAQTLVLPVKDPFHLPRALIHCLETLERLGDHHRE